METLPDGPEESEPDAYPDDPITTPKPKPWMTIKVRLVPIGSREPLASSGDVPAPENDVG